MRVLVKYPGHPMHIDFIENELEELQRLVGGYIEPFQLEPDWLILCDEEGKLKHRSYNCTVEGEQLYGTLVLVGVDGEEFTDLTYEKSKEIKEKYPNVWRGVR